MSMFDRNIKIKFNEMKYANLITDGLLTNNAFITRRAAMFTRSLFLLLGFSCARTILNTDIQTYKGMKGVIRWRHRWENVDIC
jgi:hypothetical protein